ncbi:MAG: amidohydrolase family protein [Oscillospiraceae bacterium]|nr:amidohydrolase family protein [Oscillospiraceae bacterium]
MSRARTILDAHVHLPVGERYTDLRSKKERLLSEMAKNHVDRCLVIADSWKETEIGSTEEMISLFPRVENARVFVVGGIRPFVSYQEELEKFRGYLERSQIVGIKLYTGHEEFYLTDDRLDAVYRMAMESHVPVLFHSGWEHTQYSDVDVVLGTARRYPDLQLVCCHCWYPEIRKCQQLIPYPNVAFDLSSVADDPKILRSISADVKKLIEAVLDRVMFGSDSFGCSMADHIEFIRSLELPEEIEEKVFSKNADRIYQLNKSAMDLGITR